jgi:hypothetical protein
MPAEADNTSSSTSANASSSSQPSWIASKSRQYGHRLISRALRFGRWLNSPPGRGVLKCSIAYTIASLGTFASPLAHFLGRPGGKHVVATMTVYFHPARTAGSMIEAILIAIVAVLYAVMIGILSMATSVLVGNAWGLVTLAHALVVIVFIGGAFGFMGWVKQKMGNPLVNVASTLASLAIISVVTKENAVVDNIFSNDKVVQVFKMLVMGITSASAVNLLIWRVSARGLLRGSMTKVSNTLGDMLSMITRGFLCGAEDDVELAEFSAASTAYAALYPQMTKNLREAKFEHYFVGHEKIYVAERTIVKSMETLSQSIGGLRSASNTLFAFLEETSERQVPSPPHEDADAELPIASPPISPPEADRIARRDQLMRTISASFSPQTFFELFMTYLREPMSALTSEICDTLRAAQFGVESVEQAGRTNANLIEALRTFNDARSAALQELYDHPALQDHNLPKRQAELEQVAAACGHFTFSLQSLGEEMKKHIDALEDLKYARQHSGRSWRWMAWWTKGAKSAFRLDSLEEEGLVKPIRKSAIPRGIPDAMVQQRDTYGWKAAPGASRFVSLVSQKLLRLMRKLAKDESKFTRLEKDMQLLTS